MALPRASRRLLVIAAGFGFLCVANSRADATVYMRCSAKPATPVLTFAWGASGANSGYGGSANHESGNRTFSSAVVTKRAHREHGRIVSAWRSGRHLASCTFTFDKRSADRRVPYLKVTMKNILVSGYQVSDDTETFTLNFEQIEYQEPTNNNSGRSGYNLNH